MKKEQIVKALEFCADDNSVCLNCPACERCNNDSMFLEKEALSLIREQEKRIRELEKLMKDATSLIREQVKRIRELEKEAAFWEKEADNAVAIAEGNIRAEIASGGTSCHWCEDKIKADTVQRMQEAIEERCLKGGIYPAFVKSVVEAVAKELSEEVTPPRKAPEP